MRAHAFVEIIEAEHALELLGIELELELLAELMLAEADEGIGDLILGRVEIEIIIRAQIAIGGDRSQRQDVVEADIAGQRDAPMVEPLALIRPQPGRCLVIVGPIGIGRRQHARAGHEIGLDQRRGGIAERRGGALAGIIAFEQELDVARRRPAQDRAPGERVAIVIFAVGQRIGDGAVALVIDPGDAERELALDQRGRDIAVRQHLIVTAIGERPHGVDLVGARLAADHVDRAADRVLAVKRSLRPAQHLDMIDVVEVEQRTLDAAHIDAVDIDADRRVESLQRVGLADAADEDIGVGARAAALHQIDVGDRPLDP